MLKFALLPVPAALAGLAPTLAAFETSFAHALCLDGEVYPATATVVPASEVASLSAWQVPSLRQSFDVDQVSDAAIATVETCLRNVGAATLQLGTTARETLRAELDAMAEWVLECHDEAEGPIERFANAQLYRVRRKFLRRYGARRLWMELRDERQRHGAQGDPVKRAAYLSWWYDRIAKLQRRLSWHVPGFSGEDVSSELLALLIAAVDSGDDGAFILGGAPGIEGTFSFLVKKKRWLQRRQQIREVAPSDMLGSIGARPPTGEEVVLAREQRREAGAVLERAEKRLRPRQRRYFRAVVEDAREHEYVSEVRVADRLGVHKSTVSRAVKVALEALTKSGAADVLDTLNSKAPRTRR
ncbi:MAG TPA: hypothetical protein VHX66_07215, partial [Solirubrobacteraceae bacterium]|nr:hypothetical protein [Solirubrobacteraceae bacterium]